MLGIAKDAGHSSMAPLMKMSASSLFAHTVATESEESWTMVLMNLKNVSGFDVKIKLHCELKSLLIAPLKRQ